MHYAACYKAITFVHGSLRFPYKLVHVQSRLDVGFVSENGKRKVLPKLVSEPHSSAPKAMKAQTQVLSGCLPHERQS